MNCMISVYQFRRTKQILSELKNVLTNKPQGKIFLFKFSSLGQLGHAENFNDNLFSNFSSIHSEKISITTCRIRDNGIDPHYRIFRIYFSAKL